MSGHIDKATGAFIVLGFGYLLSLTCDGMLFLIIKKEILAFNGTKTVCEVWPSCLILSITQTGVAISAATLIRKEWDFLYIVAVILSLLNFYITLEIRWHFRCYVRGFIIMSPFLEGREINNPFLRDRPRMVPSLVELENMRIQTGGPPALAFEVQQRQEGTELERPERVGQQRLQNGRGHSDPDGNEIQQELSQESAVEPVS
jgi:hypothetical protein